MPCGCEKGTDQWVYVDQSGQESEPMSEMSARALQVRAGGAGKVEPR